MKLTRRDLAGALAGAAVAAQAPQQKTETPEELRKQASERLRRSAEALAKTQLPMAAEPAFSFRA